MMFFWNYLYYVLLRVALILVLWTSWSEASFSNLTYLPSPFQLPAYSSKLSLPELRLHRLPMSPQHAVWAGASIFGATDAISTRSFTRDVYVKDKTGAVPDWANFRFNTLFGGGEDTSSSSVVAGKQGWHFCSLHLFCPQDLCDKESLVLFPWLDKENCYFKKYNPPPPFIF